jgi:colanic acid/amylovoran biosynthesis glycosyltransferase
VHVETTVASPNRSIQRASGKAPRARTVLVVRSELLPYSETFVKAQVLAYSSWHPVLVGLRRTEGLPVDDLEVRMVPAAKTLAARAYRKVLTSLRVTPADIRRRLGSAKASLVHVHFGTDAVENWNWIKTLRVPVIVTLHGYDINIDRQWWQSSSRPRAQRRYPALLLSLAANPRVHFVAVSEAIRQKAIEWGIARERISVRHIGVDLDLFRDPGPPVQERRRRIVFVGRLVEKKGVEYLIRAFALVRKQVPDAELVIVGEGRLRTRLQRLASDLEVPVSFEGILSSNQIRTQLLDSRVFCLPSVTAQNGDAEGFGLVLLEAQACGVPAVTSARGGADEGIIHEQTGFRFEERDVGAMTEYLVRLLVDDDLASRMSRLARRNIEQNFSLRACTAALEDLYDSLSTGRGVRSREALA